MTKSGKRKTVPKSGKRLPTTEGVKRKTEITNAKYKTVLESVKHTFTNFSPKVLVYLLLLVYLIPLSFFAAPSVGLDPSWRIAINLAIKEGLIFGKDFIFTYGPLGYLETRIPDFVPNFPIILFQLFIYGSAIAFIIFWIGNETIHKKLSENGRIIIPVILLIFGPMLFFSGSIMLFFYTLFFMVFFLFRRHLLIIPILSICCLLSFYIKVNTGIITNFIFLFFMIYIVARRFIPVIPFLLIVTFHYSVLYFASFALNTDFKSFVSNGLHLINSYNDAMFVLETAISPLLGVLCVILLTYPLFLSFKTLFKDSLTIFLSILFGIYIYILFKQGFTRSDLNLEHSIGFFSIMSFVGILMYVSFKSIQTRLSFVAYLFPVALVCLVGSEFKQPVYALNALSESILNTVDGSRRDTLHSIHTEMRKLPNPVVELIGDKTFDVLGFSTDYVYYNNLRFSPRPIFQSYSAYDAHLIQQNANKYAGVNAPEFVLYHHGALDNKLAFWDDPGIYFPLFTNYRIAGVIEQSGWIGNMLLFEKQPSPATVTSRVILDTIINMNTDISIPASANLIYLSMDYEYTFLGKLRRLFYQPTQVDMKLYESKTRNFLVRLVLPVMESGVPINKSIKNFDEAHQFFKDQGKQSISLSQFQIIGDPFWIEDKFHIRMTEHIIQY